MDIFTFMLHQLVLTQNPTDRDRIRAMFHHLRIKRGIYSRMSFGLNTSSALGQLEMFLPHGHPYCFFHQQDAEAFGKDGYLTRPLFVVWGILEVANPPPRTVKATPEDWIRCAERVVTAGILAGLQVTWEGTVEKRIALHPTRPAFVTPAFHSRN